jgi:hypothetical protein
MRVLNWLELHASLMLAWRGCTIGSEEWLLSHSIEEQNLQTQRAWRDIRRENVFQQVKIGGNWKPTDESFSWFKVFHHKWSEHSFLSRFKCMCSIALNFVVEGDRPTVQSPNQDWECCRCLGEVTFVYDQICWPCPSEDRLWSNAELILSRI